MNTILRSAIALELAPRQELEQGFLSMLNALGELTESTYSRIAFLSDQSLRWNIARAAERLRGLGDTTCS
jgi:hypothetical protein